MRPPFNIPHAVLAWLFVGLPVSVLGFMGVWIGLLPALMHLMNTARAPWWVSEILLLFVNTLVIFALGFALYRLPPQPTLRRRRLAYAARWCGEGLMLGAGAFAVFCIPMLFIASCW